MSRLEQIRQRREALQNQAAWQREELTSAASNMQHSLGWIDRTVSSVRGFVTSPLTLGAAVAILVILRPARLMRWGSRLGMAYGLYRRFSRSAGR